MVLNDAQIKSKMVQNIFLSLQWDFYVRVSESAFVFVLSLHSLPIKWSHQVLHSAVTRCVIWGIKVQSVMSSPFVCHGKCYFRPFSSKRLFSLTHKSKNKSILDDSAALIWDATSDMVKKQNKTKQFLQQ